MRKSALLAGAAALGLCAAWSQSAQAERRFEHVLLISVDGLHGIDLPKYVAAHPDSTFARLAGGGTVFGNALTTAPSDSFPGMIAQATGGTPKSGQVFYDDSYDRDAYAPNSGCAGQRGAEVNLAENLDRELNDVTGGGTLGKPLTQIDPKNLPEKFVDGVCKPVLPHTFIKTNTIFEVIKAHGGLTAWSDKHPAYEILSGPSGKGIDDLFTPEINSQLPGGNAGDDFTSSFQGVQQYDSIKVQAILNQIDGLDSTGTRRVGVPAIFGMNFQAVSVGEKLAKSDSKADYPGLTGGYLNANATPGTGLTRELEFVDNSIGLMINELEDRNLLGRTLVIVSAKHGQSPIDPALIQRIPDTYGTVLANDGYDFDIADDEALIWLKPAMRTQSNLAKTLRDLKANATALGIEQILAPNDLASLYRNPATNNKTPDFIVISTPGVIYTKGTKLAEHGGFSDDDRHVALLVYGAGEHGTVSDAPVETRQIAPTILRALGLDPRELHAVVAEHTHVLPGLHLLRDDD